MPLGSPSADSAGESEERLGIVVWALSVGQLSPVQKLFLEKVDIFETTRQLSAASRFSAES